MSKAREIYRVRGIDGECYPDKLTAETAARAEFPDESADLRYSRIYFLRMEENRPTQAATPTDMYVVTGFDRNREEDKHEFCFATREKTKAFIKAAEEMPYSEHITWRFDSMVAYENLEQALYNLRRDLTAERDVNGYGDDEEGEEA